MKIYKRTFEAKKHPKGSNERAILNVSAITSEYMPSYKYLVVKEDTGFTRDFRTKREAEEYIKQENIT